MSSSIGHPVSQPIAADVAVSAADLSVTLVDGRRLVVPLSWFPWLAAANRDAQLDHRLVEGGRGIWWDRLDEGLSVAGLFGLGHR
jgi:hypothetical protein